MSHYQKNCTKNTIFQTNTFKHYYHSLLHGSQRWFKIIVFLCIGFLGIHSHSVFATAPKEQLTIIALPLPIPENEKKRVERMFLDTVLTHVEYGDSLLIVNSTSLQKIALFEATRKLPNNNKIKLKVYGREFQKLQKALRQGHTSQNGSTMTAGIPSNAIAFFDYTAQLLQQYRGYRRYGIVILGSAIDIFGNNQRAGNGGYALEKGVASDGVLFAQTPFDTRTRKNQLQLPTGEKPFVQWITLQREFQHHQHEQRLTRFYSLYLQELGSRLIGITHSLDSIGMVFNENISIRQYSIDPNEKDKVMLYEFSKNDTLQKQILSSFQKPQHTQQIASSPVQTVELGHDEPETAHTTVQENLDTTRITNIFPKIQEVSLTPPTIQKIQTYLFAPVSKNPPPPPVEQEGQLSIGLQWGRNDCRDCDLDLFIQTLEHEEVSYKHREGRKNGEVFAIHLKDWTSSPYTSQAFETVIFKRSIPYDSIFLAVNFYSGKTKNGRGVNAELRVLTEHGNLYFKRIHIRASQGNRGKEPRTGKHWLKLHLNDVLRG